MTALCVEMADIEMSQKRDSSLRMMPPKTSGMTVVQVGAVLASGGMTADDCTFEKLLRPCGVVVDRGSRLIDLSNSQALGRSLHQPIPVSVGVGADKVSNPWQLLAEHSSPIRESHVLFHRHPVRFFVLEPPAHAFYVHRLPTLLFTGHKAACLRQCSPAGLLLLSSSELSFDVFAKQWYLSGRMR